MRPPRIDVEPVRIPIPLHEAVGLVCEFTERSRDEIYSACFYSPQQIEAAPCEHKIAAFWRIEVAYAERIDDTEDAPVVVATPLPGGGAFAVFDDGSVKSYDEIEALQSEWLIGRTGTMTDHPGLADIEGESRCVESNRRLPPGVEVVVVGIRGGDILLVEETAS